MHLIIGIINLFAACIDEHKFKCNNGSYCNLYAENSDYQCKLEGDKFPMMKFTYLYSIKLK